MPIATTQRAFQAGLNAANVRWKLWREINFTPYGEPTFNLESVLGRLPISCSLEESRTAILVARMRWRELQETLATTEDATPEVVCTECGQLWPLGADQCRNTDCFSTDGRELSASAGIPAVISSRYSKPRPV